MDLSDEIEKLSTEFMNHAESSDIFIGYIVIGFTLKFPGLGYAHWFK